jgi:hypothetical protein
MRRFQYYILLAPAVLALLVSAILLSYSGRFHSRFLSGEIGYKRVEEKIISLQCFVPRDLDFILTQVRQNHLQTQDTADMLWHAGALSAALAILIALSVYEASKRLPALKQSSTD